jgi:hypothetical protein
VFVLQSLNDVFVKPDWIFSSWLKAAFGHVHSNSFIEMVIKCCPFGLYIQIEGDDKRGNLGVDGWSIGFIPDIAIIQ